jgi:hypothetical protein
MKYIKNTGRYAIAFPITKNNREVKIELDRRRLYTDTGNIATTGITPVGEEDLKELKKIKRFNDMVEKGELSILEESEVRTPDENKIKALEEKNKELEQKLKEAENADVKKVEEEKKALADENASLRAQLEKLAKSNKNKDKADGKADETKVDTEGF